MLAELRTRASVVLAAAGVVSSFLGALALKNGVGAFGGFALVFLVLTIGLCLRVLLPAWGAWTFTASPSMLIEDFTEVPVRNSAEDVQRFLAGMFEQYHDENDALLGRLFAAFTGACICFSVEVALWLLQLAIP